MPRLTAITSLTRCRSSLAEAFATASAQTTVTVDGTSRTESISTNYAVDNGGLEIDYNSTTAGLNFTSDYVGSNFVTVTAVPEPATLVLVAAALTCLTVRRPRREKTGLERG
jgi:hypothetical protein